MILRSRAPVRISFAGGGTDVSPYTEEHGGCVVSATINKYAWGSLELREDPEIHLKDSHIPLTKFRSLEDLEYGGPLDLLAAVVKNMHSGRNGVNLVLRGDIPPRSGLGSSAAAFVSLIGLFSHMRRENRMTDYDIAEYAFDLEREELGNKGGRQDQYASVFGGLNYIEFRGDDFVRVNPLRIKKDYILELEKNLLLVHVMKRSKSGDIISDQVNRYVEKKKSVVDALNSVKSLAEETHRALRKGDLNRFGELLHEGWVEKKKFSPLMSNEFIDKTYDIARKHGALGGKILGAGGGGHMIFYCESGREEDVADKLTEAGAAVRSFSFDMHGLQTWEV
ncbi:MAG: GHMP kinase [Candidatus Altiarchaeales archaeon]|nr:GHMP kinase [Candidatus Altiarchaeales archaeon]MBD3415628.1 GHMP kinase [Candidatus Altiarchaeales archaeon]